jgi:hypothetical protein
MTKSFTSKFLAAAAFASLAGTTLLAPQQALAGNTTSLGHGVKCSWVLVSSNPATGSYVHKQVCRKGV